MTAEEALNLGIMYYSGQLVEKNDEKAFDYFQEAEAFGSQEAYRWLGIYYYWTRETETDFKTAFEYLEKALKFNPQDAEIMWFLGNCYYLSYGTRVKENYQKCFELNLQAAELGYKESFWVLRRCYYDGLGTKKDLEKALYWAEKFGDQYWIKETKREIKETK